MADNIMSFESLNPVIINGVLVKFTLSFYYENGNTFFAYSDLKDWLNKFQLSEVICESEDTKKRVRMYFKKYVNHKDN